jgi:hypothetical protein
MLRSDRTIFDYPLADRQQHSTNSLRNFLLFASPIVTRSIKDAALIGAKSKPINDYFGPRYLIPRNLWDVIHPIVDHFEFDLKPD